MRSQTAETSGMSCSTSKTPIPRSASAANQRAQRLRLARIHPRRRLVEQDDLRLRSERARDLEPPLLAVRKRPRRAREIRVLQRDRPSSNACAAAASSGARCANAPARRFSRIESAPKSRMF